MHQVVATVAAALLCLGAEEELSTRKIAAVLLEQEDALAAVEKAHGSKLPSEHSSEERRDIIREQAGATQAVLDRHGVAAKAFARRVAKLTLEEKDAVQAELTRLRALRATTGGPRPPDVEADAQDKTGDAAGTGPDGGTGPEAARPPPPAPEQKRRRGR